MKIIDIETTILRLENVHANGDGLQDLLLVQVMTDAGIVGVGEAHTMPLAVRALIDAPVSQFASQGLKQLLIGEDPRNVEYLWDKMWTHTSVLGRRGLIIHAMSAIDIALWDIAGKAAGVATYQLLGGRRRDTVKAYASDLMAATKGELLDNALQLKDQGFRAMKFGWGALGADPQRDGDMLAELRATLGDGVDLMLDLGMPVAYDLALKYAMVAADSGLVFLEEPLSADDLSAYAQLNRESPVPIATGEKETTRFSFIDLMDRGGMRIIQPDLARAGGITEARRISVEADARGCAVIPHSWASDILLAATMHFLVSIKDAQYLEFNVMDNPLRTDLLVDPIKPDSNGNVSVPDGIGLGIELNFDTIEKYRWDPETSTRQGISA